MSTKTTRQKAAKPATTKARANRSSASGQFIDSGKSMTPDQLHRAMVSYGKEVSANRESALAFLKRIGAPVGTSKR